MTLRTLLLLPLALMSLTACNYRAETQHHQDGFVYCGGTYPQFLNPQLSNGGDNITSIGPQLFDSLLTLDPKTYQPQPHLATSWTVNKDKTEYTFTLRKGVQFHHTPWFTPNRPMNADDVVFSFQRITDSLNAFHYVNGGRYLWFQGMGFDRLIKEVKALDEQHVKFTLTKPDSTFLENIATVFASIHSAEYAQQLIKSDQKSNLDNYPVGTGAFQLEKTINHKLVRLTRNEHYWKSPAKMKLVVFDFSHRGTGSLAKLITNECDVMANPMTSQLSAIDDNNQLHANISKAMNVSYLAINTQHFALNDVHVRQALSYAINRKNIITSIYFDQGYVATSLLPTDSWAYQDNAEQIRYDQTYAKALLKEAGFDHNLELTMLVPLAAQSYNPNPRKTAELLQSNFADIGVKLSIVMESQHINSFPSKQPNTDLVLTGWSANTGEPDSLLRPQLTCEAQQAGLNTSMWCDQDFDYLLTLARESEQTRHRLNLYHQAQTMLTQKLPIIPIAHGVQYQVHHNSLSGFALNPFNSGSFENVVREK
ncbi:MAG: ABC transporter substrate-binding protein [Vibrio sp.]